MYKTINFCTKLTPSCSLRLLP